MSLGVALEQDLEIAEFQGLTIQTEAVAKVSFTFAICTVTILESECPECNLSAMTLLRISLTVLVNTFKIFNKND